MKFILVLVCSITLSNFSNAQTATAAKKESTSDSGFQKYCKKNALTIITISSDKTGVKLNGEVEEVKVANPTYLDYNITLKEEEAQYFSIKGTNKVIKVESLYRLRLAYNQKK